MHAHREQASTIRSYVLYAARVVREETALRDLVAALVEAVWVVLVEGLLAAALAALAALAVVALVVVLLVVLLVVLVVVLVVHETPTYLGYGVSSDWLLMPSFIDKCLLLLWRIASFGSITDDKNKKKGYIVVIDECEIKEARSKANGPLRRSHGVDDLQEKTLLICNESRHTD